MCVRVGLEKGGGGSAVFLFSGLACRGGLNGTTRMDAALAVLLGNESESFENFQSRVRACRQGDGSERLASCRPPALPPALEKGRALLAAARMAPSLRVCTPVFLSPPRPPPPRPLAALLRSRLDEVDCDCRASGEAVRGWPLP